MNPWTPWSAARGVQSVLVTDEEIHAWYDKHPEIQKVSFEKASPQIRDEPGRLLQYLVDRMLAGHEQDDDVTVLVVHRP